MKNKYQMNRGLTIFLGILFTSFLGYAQNLQACSSVFQIL